MTPEKRRRPVTRASKSPSTPKSQQCSTLTRSSSENSSGELVIDVETDDDTPKHSKPDKDNELKDEKPTRVFRRKRRKMSLPDDADALFDAKFEETIRKSAAKNNLTPICVKKLLKKLVMNDHVFAIVRLKEEEEERKKNSMAENSQEGDDGDDEEDDEDVHTLPKLTRLKAKQLNQTLFPLVPLNAPATDKEVAALIREDLNSDDDDEEYKPGEDDVPSDDDPNTTISDIDSQPRTPATTVAVTGAETETELQYTKDGLFKIPKPRNDSYCSQSEQEQENIALRTRSKLCLTTTDIETLESTFIPPDITTDMYEYDGDMDQAWKDFLEEFTKPLPKDLEDDDDNDPEYVVADKVPLDAEEMRSLKVSKKELNELVSELMEMSNIDEPYLEQALNETINESLSCAQIDCRADMLRTPLPEPSELQPNTAAIQSTCPAITEKLPAIILADHSETIGSQGGNCMDQNVSVLAPHFTSTPRMLTYPLDRTRDARADNTVTEYETNETHNDALPSTSNMQSHERFFIKYSIPDETFPSADNPNEIIKPTISEVKRYRFHTTEVPVKVELSDAALGFTDFQLQLLQQQLRMHVQLNAQHFLQTYAHPLFWETAKTCKDMLEEVEAVCKTKPNILPFNLPSALECCRSWEDELAVVNESNKLFIKCLDEEITVGEQMLHKTNKHYQSELHWRIKEKMVNCKAFMYPALIPHKTFRLSNKGCKQVRFTQGELQLIAFWFERASKEMTDDHNARGPNKIMKKPTNREIINYTIKHFWPNYTWKQLDALVRNRKSIIYPNPLDFFLRNGYAPPFKHVLEHIDVNNVIPLALYQKGILPASWDRFVSSRKMTPIAAQKKESPAWEIKDEHQQPHEPSSYLRETSDATSLLCKIQILPSEESSTASEQVENTPITAINETKCESATSDAVEPSLGDLVTNSGELLLADEPKATNEMHNGVSRKKSFSSSVESVIVECTCICHASIEEIRVRNVPGSVPSRDALTVSRHNGDKNAKQQACQEPTRS
uniref:GON-4-like protein n=1 Tax=Anopheles atroparvus TaxID=41427 RepID=A0AAG5CYX5_ANOAO